MGTHFISSQHKLRFISHIIRIHRISIITRIIQQVILSNFSNISSLNFSQNQQFQPFQNFQHSNTASQPQFQNLQNQHTHFQHVQQPVQNFQQPSSTNQHQSQLALPSSTSPRSMQPQQNFSSSKIEDLMQQVLQQQQQMMQQQQHQQRTDTALQNIERQIGQLASNINQMQNQGSGQLPSQPTPNPKGNVSALTLRSGKTISDPNSNFSARSQQGISRTASDLTPQKLQNFPANSEQPDSAQHGITGADQQHFNQPATSDYDQIDEVDFGLDFTPTAAPNSAQNSAQNLGNSRQNLDRTFNQQEAEHSTPLPFPQRSVQPRKEMEEEKAREYQELVKLFSKVEVNVPLLTMIKQIPKYAKFLKDLCVHKKKLKGNELISMGKNVSALLQPVPQKCEDPGVFTVPCVIGDCIFEDAMLDLGASINVMPKSVFQSLRIGPLQPIGDTVVRFSIFEAMKHPREDHSILSVDISEELDGMEFLSDIDSDLEVSDFDQENEFVSLLEDILEVEESGSSSECVGDCLGEALPLGSLREEEVCVGDCLGEALPLGSPTVDPTQEELKPLPQHLNCQYGSRCKFLHTTQQETKPNPYGFGNQSTIHFPNTTQQQKPNPYGFGVQNKPQLQNNTPQKGSSNFVAKYQTPAKPFENKWTRSSSSGAANVTATQAQAQSQVSDHKCTDPESCKKQIIEDFKNEAPLWKLTCYGHRKYGPCDIVGDISYEELRSAAYDDARQGSSVQSIVERERKLYLSKLNEFDNLLKKPYGSQSPSFHQMNSTPISSSPQMSQSPMLMNNASSVNVQGNNVPSFSSFSQLKATTNLGYENRSDPQGFPSGNFGQPSPFQKVSQSSFGFGKFGNSGVVAANNMFFPYAEWLKFLYIIFIVSLFPSH
ncbi:hypothetical protein ZIOFF_039642 [Zingiber officinale]|uniref:C3H1-type domain-containing protein n=1 Tax=Zingiber officinale TaxID=94328 RepID=A0A8J5GGA1_ZINOF|nr:hypothetical protein ZIOFF_039642 [Zingiber officinale]